MKYIVVLYCFVSFSVIAQLKKDDGFISVSSDKIKAWPSKAWVKRGYINISDTTVLFSGSNRTSYGNDSILLKPLTSNSTAVVSLGDRGEAILYFPQPIMNDEGPDFAVFENSFDGKFLELAFVEVSDDGVNYVRFPSQSRTQTTTQIGPFNLLEKDSLYNLAGKYALRQGTPFDLEDLVGKSDLNLSNIHYVKIIDVVGSIDPKFASYDSEGNMINDPFPTPYSTCGFDLAGVAALNIDQTNAIFNTSNSINSVLVYPNPSSGSLYVSSNQVNSNTIFSIVDLNGAELLSLNYEIDNTRFVLKNIELKGVYLLKIQNANETLFQKIILQ